MKVPKSVGLDAELLEFIKKERPGFYRNFSVNVEKLLRDELMTTKQSVVGYKMTEVARKISKLSEAIEKLELERAGLERELKFLQQEKREGKK